jgi:intracellular septation protein
MVAEQPSTSRALVRFLTEAGPLIVFFIANAHGGVPGLGALLGTIGDGGGASQALFEATALFMVVTAIAVPVGWIVERRLPVVPLISGVFVLVFGGLTLALADEVFIKLKPTLVNALFATILLGGLATGRGWLKLLFGPVFQLDDAGWRKLTARWGLFFIFLAIVNEIVWRSFATETWVAFKLFGMLPMTLTFAIAQTPLIMRHQLDAGD